MNTRNLCATNQRWEETWELYDDLIDAVPDHLSVLECMAGVHWTLVRSEKGIGMAKTLRGGREAAELYNIVGIPLKELAAYVRSWNYCAEEQMDPDYLGRSL